MRRNRASPPPSPYRALAHHYGPGNAQPQDSVSLIRSFNVEANPTRPMRPSPLTASTIRDMPLDLVDRIRSFPLFMSATDDFLAAIGNHLKPQVHSAHDHILTEGDEARAMYWLVRGAVAVTSRDGEAVYAELKPGSFFGEIGILMNIPRTATIIARTKCLLLVLKKEDLSAELPKYPDMEKAILQEAQERLAILKKKRQEGGLRLGLSKELVPGPREPAPGQVSEGEAGSISEGAAVNSKKRKSPSPGVIEDPAAGSALGSGLVNVRKTLKELPLFSTLPPDILHFLGLSAQPKMYSPFTDIVRQGSPGNEIFFIVRGEAEVIHEEDENARTAFVRPRLKSGQYFGEVAGLGLSEARTATVRSITTVECLMITGQALEELWRRCPPEIRTQVEQTARERMKKAGQDDVEMKDSEPKLVSSAYNTSIGSTQRLPSTPTKQMIPQVTFTTPSKPPSPTKEQHDQMKPTDPDPFLSVDMENMRNRRRNSLAPPTPLPESKPPAMPNGTMPASDSPVRFPTPILTPPDSIEGPAKRAKIHSSPPTPDLVQNGVLPDDLMVRIFIYLPLLELLRLRIVCTDWRRILSTSPLLCQHVDLQEYNRTVTDAVLINLLAPFLGPRPVIIDLSNCFHVTDVGFNSLWRECGGNVKIWRMRSVWDVSAPQILEMAENAKGLEEVDWSNCRKVGDNLLARVVGWVVPEPPPTLPSNSKVVIANSNSNQRPKSPATPQRTPRQQQAPQPLPPGTVIGCPSLKRLNLSYCKHITDRSMAHLALHASNRLERLSLTRCTSITDAGFQAWAPFRFTHLTHLQLADCTYLTDASIVALVNAAKGLTHLDLSFCCALSDTATEVVALGLPRLVELRMAFCGSAVSDGSLGCISLHLSELEGLSVRGCVRVTGAGVEAILDGCSRLRWFDVSQCRNLEAWVRGGGVGRWGFDERGAKSPLNSAGGGGNGFISRGSSVGSFSGGIGMEALGGMMMGGGTGSMFGPGGGGRVPRGLAGAVGSARSGGLGMVGVGSFGGGFGMAPFSRRGPVRFVIEKGGGGLR